MITRLKYRWKQRWLPRIYAFFIRQILKLLALTYRFEFEGTEHFQQAAKAGSCIVILWHSRIAMMFAIMQRIGPSFNYIAVTSNSRDGEMIASMTTSHRNGSVLRVAHDRRSDALKEMIATLRYGKKKVLILTPDGPRGPKEKVKKGVVLTAQSSGAPIVPIHWHASSSWRLPTWDQMLLPKPFSKVRVTFGAPETLNDDGELNQEQERLENALSACAEK